ncbi:hypothetical protein MmTuc01_3405 [Methanosarcina mazei Tuc01]|uniref:Uncharacterized protein n=1 Tax=Methanosarcina mazei Tuc01 TaxID=1236903 RepID=M1QNP5_METMZ|nr:hypothetical protein MmTuc01_3405 [Methanosarcina mazei Tuc01]
MFGGEERTTGKKRLLSFPVVISLAQERIVRTVQQKIFSQEIWTKSGPSPFVLK